jgi:hypothetical protein
VNSKYGGRPSETASHIRRLSSLADTVCCSTEPLLTVMRNNL